VDWDATAKPLRLSRRTKTLLQRRSTRRNKPRKLKPCWMWMQACKWHRVSSCHPAKGMFLIDGKSVRPLEQVGSQVKTDKKQS